jgi:uncharacterized protein (TIGR03435 family)
MRKPIALFAALLLTMAAILFGAGPLAFEVASIKVADPGEAGPGDIPRNMDNSPGHFIMRNVPLRYCLEWAYDLKDYQVSGPDWIKSDNRYDIVANAPGALENDMRAMLQTLLLERFQMKVHRETKNLDVYALLPGKGAPKFKEATADEETGLGAGPNGSVKFTRQPISRFTFMLTRRMDRPAIDMTGLKGLYDFTIDLSGLGFSGNPPQDGSQDTSAPSVFTTVQDNLGLRLEAQKAPIDVLVIDRAEKVPTAN